MLKIKKNYISLLIALVAVFIIFFSTTDSFGQKGGKGRYRKVALTKGAKKNGYTVTDSTLDKIKISSNKPKDKNS